MKALHLPEDWQHSCSITVVGCGGTGSEIVDALCRLDHVCRAVGHPGLSITLIDGDTVSPSNVGRQRFLACDVGLNKAQVLAARYGMLLGVELTALPEFLRKADCRRYGRLLNLQSRPDLLITAVDRASVRTMIADQWAKVDSGPLWLDCGNGASTGQVVLGHLAGREPGRLPHVLDLFPEIRNTPDDDEPSCSVAAAIRSQNLGVNRFLADVAVFTLLAPLFMHGRIECHGALIDMAKPLVSPIAIDPKTWDFFGYTPPVEST